MCRSTKAIQDPLQGGRSICIVQVVKNTWLGHSSSEVPHQFHTHSDCFWMPWASLTSPAKMTVLLCCAVTKKDAWSSIYNCGSASRGRGSENSNHMKQITKYHSWRHLHLPRFCKSKKDLIIENYCWKSTLKEVFSLRGKKKRVVERDLEYGWFRVDSSSDWWSSMLQILVHKVVTYLHDAEDGWQKFRLSICKFQTIGLHIDFGPFILFYKMHSQGNWDSFDSIF